MRASEWEFRYRFWIICALFTAAFYSYRLDHTNVGVAVAHLLSPGTDLDAPAGRGILRAIFLVASLPAVAGAALRSWASAYLRSEIVHDTAMHAESLVADGPFRHVRNPLYLGNLLLALGMGFLASRLGAVVLNVGQTLFLLRLIGREEALLAASGGQRFEAYRAAVPRLVPSLTPRVPRGGVEPRWAQGIAGEAFIWILAASMLAFALTLNARLVPAAAAVGFIVYWILFAVWKRRGRARQRPS